VAIVMPLRAGRGDLGAAHALSCQPEVAEVEVAQGLRRVRDRTVHVLGESVEQWVEAPDQVVALVPWLLLELEHQAFAPGRIELAAGLEEQSVELGTMPVRLVPRSPFDERLLDPGLNRLAGPRRLAERRATSSPWHPTPLTRCAQNPLSFMMSHRSRLALNRASG